MDEAEVGSTLEHSGNMGRVGETTVNEDSDGREV